MTFLGLMHSQIRHKVYVYLLKLCCMTESSSEESLPSYHMGGS